MSTRAGEAGVDLADLVRASAVFEGKWTILILAHLAHTPARFGDLRRALDGISEKVLMQRLRTLEAEGLVSRSVSSAVPPEVTYAMTPHGFSLCPVVEAMATWGGAHRRFHQQRGQ